MDSFKTIDQILQQNQRYHLFLFHAFLFLKPAIHITHNAIQPLSDITGGCSHKRLYTTPLDL